MSVPGRRREHHTGNRASSRKQKPSQMEKAGLPMNQRTPADQGQSGASLRCDPHGSGHLTCGWRSLPLEASSAERHTQKSRAQPGVGGSSASSSPACARIHPRAHINLSDSWCHSRCHEAGSKGLETAHLRGRCCQAPPKSPHEFSYKIC